MKGPRHQYVESMYTCNRLTSLVYNIGPADRRFVHLADWVCWNTSRYRFTEQLTDELRTVTDSTTFSLLTGRLDGLRST
jgi:hypothetical protein